MERENEDEDAEQQYALMDDCEIYIVFDQEEKIYQAYLQVYNYNFGVCFVLPLKRLGTDPVKLGQIVHNEIRLIIPSLDNQFMQVDENQEIIIHESIRDSSIDTLDVGSMLELKDKMENNKVFMVIGHDTLQ